MRRRRGESKEEFDSRRALNAIHEMHSKTKPDDIEVAARRLRDRPQSGVPESPRERLQRHKAEARRQLWEEAERGVHEAGRKLLQRSLGAVGKAVELAGLGLDDQVALAFLHEGLQQFLVDGVKLERALGIEVEKKKRGRPPKPPPLIEAPRVWQCVVDVMQEQITSAGQPNRAEAIKIVAKQLSMEEGRVRHLFQFAGGMRAFRAWRKDNC